MEKSFFENAKRNALKHLVQQKINDAKAAQAPNDSALKQAFLDLAHTHNSHWIVFIHNMANVPGSADLLLQMRAEATDTALALIAADQA